jgi:hypothetical protein
MNIFKNKGFFPLWEDRPFPAGIKNDVWIIEQVGVVGSMFHVDDGDIMICINDNPGGNSIENAWIVIPRSVDFEPSHFA